MMNVLCVLQSAQYVGWQWEVLTEYPWRDNSYWGLLSCLLSFPLPFSCLKRYLMFQSCLFFRLQAFFFNEHVSHQDRIVTLSFTLGCFMSTLRSYPGAGIGNNHAGCHVPSSRDGGRGAVPSLGCLDKMSNIPRGCLSLWNFMKTSPKPKILKVAEQLLS